MNNTQFATALHILTMLARTGEHVDSGYMAGSIGINSAIVRKALSTLRNQGLVVTREGKGGGATLAKPADQIQLSEIYHAVSTSRLLGKANQTNPNCQVGRQINNHLDNLYAKADQVLISHLGTLTLADFCNQFD